MQAYSIVKGKSRSDDGIEWLPEYPVGERKTISDDGFESFPEYNFHGKIQSYESQRPSERLDDDTQIQPSDSATEQVIPTVTAKRRRRRIIQKNKRKNRKSKAADTDEGADSKTTKGKCRAPGVESGDEADLEDLAKCTHEEELLSRTSLLTNISNGVSTRKTMTMIKVAEDEEFEFGAEEVDFIERFKKMTVAQQRIEMGKVLGGLLQKGVGVDENACAARWGE